MTVPIWPVRLNSVTGTGSSRSFRNQAPGQGLDYIVQPLSNPLPFSPGNWSRRRAPKDEAHMDPRNGILKSVRPYGLRNVQLYIFHLTSACLIMLLVLLPPSNFHSDMCASRYVSLDCQPIETSTCALLRLTFYFSENTDLI